ncbi:MAG: TraB/GumN family protein, partial [Bacteroidota bacterium]
MKKMFLCLGLLSLLNLPFSWSQETTNIELEADDNPRNSLLWEVSGNGLDEPSYVFGTIHIIGKDDYFFTDKMQAAFDSSELVIFEIKVDDMMNPMSLMSMMGKIMMNDGTSLSDLLTEEEYAMVN